VHPALVWVTALLLLAVPVTIALVLRADGTPAAEPSPSGPALDCPPVERPSEGAVRADLLEGDLDGDGCPQPVLWDGAALTAAVDPDEDGQRYVIEVGPPGEDGRRPDDDAVVVLGDWDCDGRDTPALYQPETGEAFLFAGWATADDALATSETVRGARFGEPRIRTVDEGGASCDVLEVIRPELDSASDALAGRLLSSAPRAARSSRPGERPPPTTRAPAPSRRSRGRPGRRSGRRAR
jgi:hypothetical protein